MIINIAVQKSCNTETNQNVTYFVNPEWPGTFDGSVECPITVQKVDSNICQYRYVALHTVDTSGMNLN